jgi:N-acetylglucosaminyl-diphospho-decaprenol L-rhamnosyltransferase
MADDRARVACVVVTYDALPWIQQCLESVEGIETVVVDNGSSDGTVDVVRDRFPAVRVIESSNDGLAAGWNRGIAGTESEHVVVLNADAWLVADALSELVAAADRHPRAAAIGPKLLDPDGSLQRSVRGFPTTWRLATEYLYLRKLAPGTHALNAFYGAGFDHGSERVVDWVMGACFLLRRSAYEEVGPFDDRFFLFSEEVDWMRRATDRGWSVVFTPEARCVHVSGAAHGGRLFRENVRGHLLYLSLHGRPGEAERARRLLRASLLVRGRLHGGQRALLYREVAAWLGSGDVEALLDG